MSEFKKLKPGVYLCEDQFMNPIKEFYVGVYINPDGSQGVMSFIENKFPFVERILMGATTKDRDKIIKTCDEYRKEHGIKCKVLKFTNVEVVEEFN